MMNFQSWDNDPDFNILNFIGDDDQNDPNSLAQEDPKEKLAKTIQYNHTYFGGGKNSSYEEIGK